MADVATSRSKNVTKDDLIDKLLEHYPDLIKNQFSKANLPKNSLLKYCCDAKLISPDEAQKNTFPRVVCRKCYLDTFITNGLVREKIKRLAQAHSVCHYRAYKLLNFIAADLAGVPLLRGDDDDGNGLPWFSSDPSPDDARNSFFVEALASSTPKLIIHCYTPERYENNQRYPLHPHVQRCLQQHGSLVSHLKLSDRNALIEDTGWHSIASSEASQIRATCCTYLRRMLVKNAIKFIKLFADTKEAKSNLVKLLCKTLPTEMPAWISESVWNQIILLRNAFDIGRGKKMPKIATKMTEKLWQLHVHFVKHGVHVGSILPLGSFERKHVFLDAKIMCALMTTEWNEYRKQEVASGRKYNDIKHSEFMELKGWTLREWYSVQNSKRDFLQNQGPEASKRWLGKKALKTPSHARITSMLTDGVSLVIRIAKSPDVYGIRLPPLREALKTTPTMRSKQKKLENRNRQRRMMDQWQQSGEREPSILAIDTGRAKLITARASRGRYTESSFFVYRRSSYYYHIHYKRRQQEIARKMAETEGMEQAMIQLNKTDKKRRLPTYMLAHKLNMNVLYPFFIESNYLALMKMQAWKLKQGALDHMFDRLFRFARQRRRRLLIGWGNASFPSTGKGQLPAPTKMLRTALYRAIKRHNLQAKPSERACFIMVDEYKTTKICNRCKSETQDVEVQKRVRKKRPNFEPESETGMIEHANWKDSPPERKTDTSTRLRECKTCGLIVDRDYNAAANLLELTFLEYKGRPRHHAFCRPQPNTELSESDDDSEEEDLQRICDAASSFV